MTKQKSFDGIGRDDEDGNIDCITRGSRVREKETGLKQGLSGALSEYESISTYKRTWILAL